MYLTRTRIQVCDKPYESPIAVINKSSLCECFRKTVSRKIEYILGWKKEAWEGYDAAIKRMLELPWDEYKNKPHRPSIKGVLLGLPVITGLSILGVIVWIKYR